MQFEIPTTKEQMYATLKDIFDHYRLSRESYQGVQLKELSLEDLEMEIPTDEQLTQRAEINTLSSQIKEKLKYTDEINDRLTEISALLEELSVDYAKGIESIEKDFSQSTVHINQNANSSDIEGSGLVFAELSRLERQKNARLDELNEDTENKRAELIVEQELLRQKLEGVEQYFEPAHSAETEAEYLRLKEENEKLKAEVFKYNNSLSERKQKYSNALKQVQANLELRFMSVKSEPLTKEQLIEYGYYDDVIECVCGYYNALDPITAYNDVKSEGRLALYLEDYYQSIIYLYKTRAE